MKVDWQTPAKIEHKVAKIIAKQERDGWPFRLEQAKQYVSQLDAATRAAGKRCKSSSFQ